MQNQVDAARDADNMIELIIKSQPNLMGCPANGAGEATGDNLGKFFVALRTALIAEYLKTPRR